MDLLLSYSRRNVYRHPGRERNCVQVSASVLLVTFGEINDGAAAGSAPCIPRAWPVVDVYVQRLVSVTETLLPIRAGEPAARRKAAHTEQYMEDTLRRRP